MNTAVASLASFVDDAPVRPRVDWFAIIIQLETVMSLEDIAQRCGRWKGTVRYWKQGGEPKHYDGGVLISLYERTFPGRSTPLQKGKNLSGT